ncbi:MAG: hypothetical protein AB9921_08125 [Erysipelotrichaceae bacterium]
MKQLKPQEIVLCMLVVSVIGLSVIPSVVEFRHWLNFGDTDLTEVNIAEDEFDHVYSLSTMNTLVKTLEVLDQEYSIEYLEETVRLSKQREGFDIEMVFELNQSGQTFTKSRIIVQRQGEPMNDGHQIETIFVFKLK